MTPRKTTPATPDPPGLHSDVPDFLGPGQRAQAGVDAILAAKPERRRIKRPKGTA